MAVEALSVAEWRKRADAVPDCGTPAAVAFWAALHAIADHADFGSGGNAFPDYPRLALRVKRSGRKIQDDVVLAESLGLLVAKRRRNKPKVYQLSWPAGRAPADVAADIARLRVEVAKKRAKGKKVWNGPAPSDPGTAPEGLPLERTPGEHSGTDPRGLSGTDPAGSTYLPSTPHDQGAAAAAAGATPRRTGEADEAPGRLTDDELAAAVEHRVSEIRAGGKPIGSEAGLRHTLRTAFVAAPCEGREVLARANTAKTPRRAPALEEGRRQRQQDTAEAARVARDRALSAFNDGTLPPDMLAEWTAAAVAQANRSGVRANRDRFIGGLVVDSAAQWVLEGAVGVAGAVA